MNEPAKTVVRLSKAAHPLPAQEAGPETQPDTQLGVTSAGSARGPGRVAAPSRPRSPFLPLSISSLALLLWLGFWSWQLWSERQGLQATHARQQQTVDTASQLRTSLDTLAADTQRLADTGNASARLLVEELKTRGVTINVAAGAGGAAKAP
jgi:hypothetical protein